MAAPGKSSMRWGSFLSQAVAGVESRLDNMLTEAEDAQQQQQQQQAQRDGQAQPSAQPSMSASPIVRTSPSPSGTSSNAPSRSASAARPSPNDRLQARLAKAMAGKTAGHDNKSSASPRTSMDTPSRSSVERQSFESRSHEKKTDPTAVDNSPKPSLDQSRPSPAESGGLEPTASTSPTKDDRNMLDEEAASTLESAPAATGKMELTADTTVEVAPATQPSAALTRETANQSRAETTAKPPPLNPNSEDQDVAKIVKETEDAKALQQVEIQEYVERIDSLQSKLQYLSKSAAETAKKTAKAAPNGSLERRLAEKDEKIALLMEEGQKLSGTEHKLRMAMKKLRQQVAEHEKQAETLRGQNTAALAETEMLRHRLDTDAEDGKRQEESRKALASLQKENEVLRKEGAAKDEALGHLERSLRAEAESDAALSLESQNKMLAAEQAKQKQLEESIAALKADNESLVNKGRLQTVELTEKLERANERIKAMEAETKLELLSMENKLEAMRSAAEEAVSEGNGGDGQVNLLRQIETLQSQYATASSNWQGIEASLLAKVSNLEKERDDAQGRESEIRKKARETAGRCRRLEEEVQDLQSALTTSTQELDKCREEVASLRESAKKTESALDLARSEVETERQQRMNASARDVAGEGERRQWPDDMPAPMPRRQSRPDSPLLAVARTLSSDFAGYQMASRSRRTPVSGSRPDSPAEGLSMGRRLSSQPPIRPSALTPTLSSLPPAPFSPFEPPSESNLMSPSIAERDDPNDDRLPSSPRQVAQDMISVSTVGAGPSVQLVERMSAAIRRLEAEKVAAKEEMARISSQRDEARSDMVALMKEVDESRSASCRVSELQKELDGLNARYQTTLELLGEKSELVEELKADVQDVKAMYRELVERTVK